MCEISREVSKEGTIEAEGRLPQNMPL